MPLIEITCEQCGIHVMRKARPGRTPRFCSQKCLHDAYRVEHETVTCKVCGKQFTSPVSQKRQVCSLACNGIAKRTEKKRTEKSGSRARAIAIYAEPKPKTPNPNFVRPKANATPWNPNGQPLCQAHNSEHIETTREGWVFRCKVCHATRLFPFPDATNEAWQTRARRAAKAELVEAAL